MKGLLHRWVSLRRILLIVAVLALDLRAVEASPADVTARPAHYVIGISPFLEPSVRDDVFRRIATFVLDDMPAGSVLGIQDAYALRTVATLSVPDTAAYRSSRARAVRLRDELNRLRRFLGESGQGTNGPVNLPTAAVRLPQFLDFIAGNPGPADLPLVVLVLGSPLYADPREPSFAMVDGYVPSDGHLVATREQSVFGTRQHEIPRTNSILHLAWFGDPWISDLHRERVHRFWSLYAARRGFQPGAFTADLPTAFAALAAGRDPSGAGVVRFSLDPSQTKLEMIRITRDAGVADWITRDIGSTASPPPPRATLGPMKIGIRWQGDVDLDLYSKPGPGAETLFFEHPRSPEGYYFKDHRSSPRREYEFIEFEVPVDVHAVSARINFYAGTSDPGPSGEVRIEFEGRIYSAPFAIQSGNGNQGRDGRSQSGFWAEIDVPAVLGLGSRNRTSTGP